MMDWSDGTGGGTAVRVTVPTLDNLLETLGVAFRGDDGHAVATLNLDHAVKMHNDPAFLEAYRAHDLVTADGNPVVVLSRLAGQSDVELVPGSDAILPIARLAAEMRVAVALFGSTEASLEAARATLSERVPGLDIALTLSPPMGFDPVSPAADAAIEEIGASGARLVFLALGAPKQERFAVRAHAALPHVSFLSIGAGLDFISGRQTRAPEIVRRLSMEWLWRLATNPRRFLGRYLACIALLPRLAGIAIAARRRQM